MKLLHTFILWNYIFYILELLTFAITLGCLLTNKLQTNKLPGRCRAKLSVNLMMIDSDDVATPKHLTAYKQG